MLPVDDEPLSLLDPPVVPVDAVAPVDPEVSADTVVDVSSLDPEVPPLVDPVAGPEVDVPVAPEPVSFPSVAEVDALVTVLAVPNVVVRGSAGDCAPHPAALIIDSSKKRIRSVCMTIEVAANLPLAIVDGKLGHRLLEGHR